MKKVLIPMVAIAIASFVFSSCKKDYTCTCVTHDSSGSIADVTTSFAINDAKEDDAEAACNLSEVTVGTLSTTCNLD